MEDYGECNEEWLRDFLDLPHGIPSYLTFQRVISQIEPSEFHSVLVAVTKSVTVQPPLSY